MRSTCGWTSGSADRGDARRAPDLGQEVGPAAHVSGVGQQGNTVTTMGMRTDVLELLPASMKTADMAPDAPGTWLLHCHVNDHIAAGMSTRYQIR